MSGPPTTHQQTPARQSQARNWNRTCFNFLPRQAPVGRKETWAATQILRAGNLFLSLRYASPVMGVQGPTPLVKGRWPKARGDRDGRHGGRGGKAVPADCAHPLAVLWFLSARAERNSPPGRRNPPAFKIISSAQRPKPAPRRPARQTGPPSPPAYGYTGRARTRRPS